MEVKAVQKPNAQKELSAYTSAQDKVAELEYQLRRARMEERDAEIDLIASIAKQEKWYLLKVDMKAILRNVEYL